MKYLNYICLLLYGITHLQSLTAQTTSVEGALPSVNIRFYTEPIFEGVYKDVEVPRDVLFTLIWGTVEQPGIETIRVTFGRLSQAVTIEGFGPIRVYEGNLTAEETVAKSPLYQIENDVQGGAQIIHVIPTAPGRYLFNAQNVSEGEIRKGTARVVNLSGETIAAMVAEGRGIIEPNASINVSLLEIERFQLKMRYATQGDEGWKLVYGTRVSASPQDRLLIYVFRKWGNRGPWRVRLIDVD